MTTQSQSSNKRRRTGSKTWKKGTSSLSQQQKNEISRIARKVAIKSEEVKKWWSSGSLLTPYTPIAASMGHDAIYLLNPFHLISVGVSDFNRLGDSIIPKYCHLKIQFEPYHDILVNSDNSEIYIRVIAFWSSSQLACSSLGVPQFSNATGLNPAQTLMINSSGPYGYHNNSFLDYDNITPVHDKVYVVPQNQSPVTAVKSVRRKYLSLSIKMPQKKMQYQDGSSGLGAGGFFKDKNFYFGVMCDYPNSSVDPLCYMEANMLTTFTDA